MQTNQGKFKLAAIQAEPVWFDRDASTAKACKLIEEAGASGVTLAAFSETWLPGYPFFIRTSPVAGAASRYLSNAVKVPSRTTDLLCQAALRAGIDVVIGIVELNPETHGTVYATLLFIGREGGILGKHRKLKPTLYERLMWGEGDAEGLQVFERPYARISGLNCWEHMMMLPGYALAAQGTQVHVAAWPTSGSLALERGKGLLLSQAFAAQAGCYVIAVGSIINPDNVDEPYRKAAEGLARLPSGGSCIIAPGGAILDTAPHQEPAMLVVEADLNSVLEVKAICDIGGHYSRPDVLGLVVNGERRMPLSELGNESVVSTSSADEPE
ncbi:MAG: carbon-nitrogen hydrolase family protein [Rhodospirillaceae bacterium]|jgi:nitrilase|nr:carbon-nitrogen hydrolase family protein [Rhodospirillaceae bacterium]MBT4687162.1 carbon-nitrogen hydrolase family protein [Rhodospirillaceae bacterium]MBT5080075.1 carbon-nitrogen hydrolase family protein [Rhodospirillaceae bacterium]MBT5524874.1 carbon-nitrogen hydrolase family protein [Rhodospirillaceae bacterium]MBT5880819.1 carbon-nitrogen hydrolase family protein [Rhodospirillaceae bacterium]